MTENKSRKEQLLNNIYNFMKHYTTRSLRINESLSLMYDSGICYINCNIGTNPIMSKKLDYLTTASLRQLANILDIDTVF